MIPPLKQKISAATVVIYKQSQDKTNAVINRILVKIPRQQLSKYQDFFEKFPDPSQQGLLIIDAMQNPTILSTLNRFSINGKRLLLRDKNFPTFIPKIIKLLRDIGQSNIHDVKVESMDTRKIVDDLYSNLDSKSIDSLVQAPKLKYRNGIYDAGFQRDAIGEGGNSPQALSRNAKSMLEQIETSADQHYGKLKPQRFLHGLENPSAYEKRYMELDDVRIARVVGFDLTGDEMENFVEMFKTRGIPLNNVLFHGNRLTIQHNGYYKNPKNNFVEIGSHRLQTDKENLPIFSAITKALKKIVDTDKELIQEKDVCLDMLVPSSVLDNTLIIKKDNSLLHKDYEVQNPVYIKEVASTLLEKIGEVVVKSYDL